MTETTNFYIETGNDRKVEIDGTVKFVPQWFMSKNNIAAVNYFAGKQTEKAILVNVSFERVAAGSDVDGTAWVPKSILQTADEYVAERKAKDNRYANNCRYSNYLKELAAANGVKIGNLSSWEKIQAKLTKNGVAFKTRDEF